MRKEIRECMSCKGRCLAVYENNKLERCFLCYGHGFVIVEIRGAIH